MRKYLIFGVVALPTIMANISSTSVAVAFPSMVSHFDTSLVTAGWVLGIYPLVVIAVIPVVSRLSDSVGRRSTFTMCVAAFVTGSLLCAIAPNMAWLIFFRVIQAAGGGGFISSATGIISDELPEKRQQFIGLLSSTNNFGAVLGPNVGGFMVQYLGWQSIFWLNVPIGITALVLCRYCLKADVKKSKRAEVDFLGVGMLAGFASAIMISLTLMGKDYNVTPIAIGAIALTGVWLLIMFVQRSKTSPGAVVSMKLLTNRPFLAATSFNFCYGFCTQMASFLLFLFLARLSTA